MKVVFKLEYAHIRMLVAGEAIADPQDVNDFIRCLNNLNIEKVLSWAQRNDPKVGALLGYRMDYWQEIGFSQDRYDKQGIYLGQNFVAVKQDAKTENDP